MIDTVKEKGDMRFVDKTEQHLEKLQARFVKFINHKTAKTLLTLRLFLKKSNSGELKKNNNSCNT
ncbi:MAG: hypothetical protein AAF806_10625 [Bacteroidota bacterium]